MSMKQKGFCRTKEYFKLHYQKNKDKLQEYAWTYREANKELVHSKNNLYAQSIKGKFSQYKQKAKQRNIVWAITLYEFESFWQKPCHYCDDTIVTIGLDRINSVKGYTLDNIVPCCEICNKAKRNLSLKDFLQWVKRLTLKCARLP